MSTALLRRHCDTSSYYEALRSWGFQVNRTPHLDSVWERLSVPFRDEYRIEVDGRFYWIDYQIAVDERAYFVEVDGHSHYTARSIYHRQNRKGLTPAESLAQKQARDRTIDQYCLERDWPLLRIEHYQFLRLTHETLRGLLAGKVSPLSFADPPEILQQAIGLYQSGRAIHDIAADLSIGVRTVMRWRDTGILGLARQMRRDLYERHKAAIDLRLQDSRRSIASIARELGMGEKNLMAFLSQDGMVRRRKLSQILRKQICDLRQAGKTPSEIAAQLNVSFHYVSRVSSGVARNAI